MTCTRAEARQGQCVTSQMNDGVASEGFDAFIFEEQRSTGIVFDVEASASDGDRDVRMLLDLLSLFAGRSSEPRFPPRQGALRGVRISPQRIRC